MMRVVDIKIRVSLRLTLLYIYIIYKKKEHHLLLSSTDEMVGEEGFENLESSLVVWSNELVENICLL